MLSKIFYLLLMAVGAIYIINPTAGFLELIPDNLPLVGNLDEAAATGMLIWAFGRLRGRKQEGSPQP